VSSTEHTANVLGLTLESIILLLAAGERTTLLLELIDAKSGEFGSIVVCGGVVVYLVNGDSSVDDIGLNSLLVDNGLDGLVDVVMDVLTAYSRGSRL